MMNDEGRGPGTEREALAEGELTETVHVERMEHTRALLGRRDCHLRLLRDTFGIRVSMRGGALTLAGDRIAVLNAAGVMREIIERLEKNPQLSPDEVKRAIRDARRQKPGEPDCVIEVFPPSRKIFPRTAGQADYVRTMRENDLAFCVGPAGSGKTYLAVALAVAAIKADRVRKIVLTRPAVEAGEKLGYLPGDIQAKVNPYLRPLYDALQDMMAVEQIRKYMETDLLEVAPLAYMRGRTLDHAFIILDEGQNCTHKQMKMFLTRLGSSSKCVVTGDITQIDLPASEVSGMIEAMRVLSNIQGIGFVRLSQADIIRHRLVQDIVDAYDGEDKSIADFGISQSAIRNQKSE